MSYRTARKLSTIYIVSDALKLTYVLMSKSGSSTIRDMMGTKNAANPNWNYTVFTVVRDPLERSVSWFFEIEWKNHKKKSGALQAFDNATAKLARTKGDRGHGHGQRTVFLPPGHSYDFVGTLATIATDWAQLGELQKQRFGIVNWPQVVPRQRDPHSSYGETLDVATLPVSLKQRVCNIYRDDYCCFHLPVPAACRVDCAGGLPQRSYDPT
ncbi:unnamed protein product [Prorocentrum cordatum]|uniref:Uncharacterized protein n=1 Tax=Prorocentrum cordatum TaxID=2364126 RepID=A0ABN9TK54_9DINO|nr:unnamed protein product [Polarella glacialis]